MKPVLIEIGYFTIYSYGLMLAIGFILATAFAMRAANKNGINAGKILDLCLFILITGIIGSRILYVALNWPYFSANPADIILLNKGGLAIYGGFALAIPASVWFIKKSNLPFWKTADLLSPYIALAQSVGRIGCFLNGCCYGKPTDIFLGVYFPGKIFKVHPAQLYSAAGLFIIFLILTSSYKKRRSDGTVFLLYLILYSVFRFFIEMLRGDTNQLVFGLTLFQCLSLVLFLGSAIVYFIRGHKRERL